jgi:hypothetical protein
MWNSVASYYQHLAGLRFRRSERSRNDAAATQNRDPAALVCTILFGSGAPRELRKEIIEDLVRLNSLPAEDTALFNKIEHITDTKAPLRSRRCRDTRARAGVTPRITHGEHLMKNMTIALTALLLATGGALAQSSGGTSGGTDGRTSRPPKVETQDFTIVAQMTDYDRQHGCTGRTTWSPTIHQCIPIDPPRGGGIVR